MTVSEFERFATRIPIRIPHQPEVIKGRQWPPMTYLSSGQIPEANLYADLSWIYGIPEPNPAAPAQVRNQDQLFLYIGMDPDTPQVLGGTVEFYLGGQPIVFNTTTSVFVPKGTPYGPVTWKEFQRPHVQLAMVFGTGDPHGGPALQPVGGGANGIPQKTQNFDYEQCVIRSPMREAGPEYIEGRQNPTMTYLSHTQINLVNNYIEFGWIWDIPSSPIPKMRHDNYDELVFHIGSDPDNPEALGGILEFGMGEGAIKFDTTHCVYIPKRLNHGPLIWKEVRRPLIELAMMLGAGTWAEGWEGSFFDLLPGDPKPGSE